MRLVDRPFSLRLTHIQVLVEFYGDGPTSLPHPNRGIRVNAGEGPIRSAYLPIARLQELSGWPGVRSVAPSIRLYPRIDQAIRAVGQQGLERLQSETSGNVVIGIIDTGLDVSLSDFRGRVVGYWDQTIHGPGVPGAGYGQAYDHPTHMRRSEDAAGHGTHLASIAAGAGRSPGINPKAKLVVVKTGFAEAEILDGIRFVGDVARAHDLPAVVNLSLGGHAGPHDGTGQFSRSVGAMCGPGRLICAAAGNEGTTPIHVHCRLRPSEDVVLPLMLQRARGEAGPEAHLYGWAEIAGSGHVEVAVEGPPTDGASKHTGYHEPVRGELGLGDYPIAGGHVRIALPPKQERSQRFIVDIVPGGNSPALGPWRVHVRNVSKNDAILHVWSGEHPDGPAAWFATGITDSAATIGEPGDAANVITVGASTTRLAWHSRLGHEDRLGVVGQIASFSSRGPLRNGKTTKPDLVAPGEWLVAARSSAAVVSEDLQVGSSKVAFRGTSQATAFASGWFSLLLAESPELDPAQARRILETHTYLPPNADASRWGRGRIGAALGTSALQSRRRPKAFGKPS